MNRNITNAVRHVMDEWIPPAIRDSRWFMRPFYWLAYRGKNLEQAMEFKTLVHEFTPEDYERFYNSLDSISRNRLTDLNASCVDFILDRVDPHSANLLDVGCGLGYLLGRVRERHPHIQLSGLDIKTSSASPDYDYHQGNIEQLPFPDKSFDVVTCCHTLEHLLNLDQCIAELIRVTRRQLFIVVPKQRYFYYTLDEHVHFFAHRLQLIRRVPIKRYECHELGGDWAYLGLLHD